MGISFACCSAKLIFVFVFVFVSGRGTVIIYGYNTVTYLKEKDSFEKKGQIIIPRCQVHIYYV